MTRSSNVPVSDAVRQLAARGEQLLRDERACRPSAPRPAAGGWPTLARPRCPRSGRRARRDRAAAAVSRSIGRGAGARWPRGPQPTDRRAGTTSGWWVAMIASRWLARDARQERDEGPGRGVGAVEILEDEDDRLPLPEPPEQPEDALERARLAPLRGRRGARRSPARAGLAQAGSEVRQEADDVRRAGTEAGRPARRRAARGGVGPIARMSGPYGSSVTARPGVARAGSVIGSASGRPSARSPRPGTGVTPTPAVPLDEHRPRAAAGRRRPARRRAARRPPRAPRTARSCTCRRMAHSTGGSEPSAGPERVVRTCRACRVEPPVG